MHAHRIGLWGVLALALGVIEPAWAQDGPRHALLIGNDAYPGNPPALRRPHADVELLATALEEARFEVTTLFDASAAETEQAVANLAKRLKAGGGESVGFFYYAGHGAVATAGARKRNFMLPANTSAVDAVQFAQRGVRLDKQLSALENGRAGVLFVVYDACRNELDRGLRRTVDEEARPGMLIAMSTSAYSTTPDNGDYAEALAEQIRVPNQTAVDAFNRASSTVAAQRPSDELPSLAIRSMGTFCFHACPQPGALASPRPRFLVDASGAPYVVRSDGSIELVRLLSEDVPPPTDSDTVHAYTLNGYGPVQALPSNPNSYLSRLLWAADWLTRARGEDGAGYAQCVPEGSPFVNNRTRFAETAWPAGCWNEPLDMRRDPLQVLESPGMDCSSFAWWAVTRSCRGNMLAPLPERRGGESASAHRDREWHVHTQARGCLLMSNESFRGGFLATSRMVRGSELMRPHWEACSGGQVRTGDLLVTRNRRGSGGAAHFVVDPMRRIIVGAHVLDRSWTNMSDAERAWLAPLAPYNAAIVDTGAEYQYLSSLRGLGGEKVVACWRHRQIAREWGDDPTSRGLAASVDWLPR